MRRLLPLILLLLAFLIAGSLFAMYTPDWQAPDEPAHYNYVRQLASGRWPVMEPGDYDQEYQSQVISSGFDPGYGVDSFEYEDYQPPLYYLLQVPVFLAFDGALRPLRLTSVVIGAGIVILAYLVALQLFPGQRWLALTAAAFVAFLPQHVAMLAAVNNDSLAELLIAAILLILIWQVKGSRERRQSGQAPLSPAAALALGLLLGLGFLTKVTVYLMAPVVALAVIWLYWGDWRGLLSTGLLLFGPALALGAIWWGRNLSVYGGLDVLGIGIHNDIVVGQPRTSEWIAQMGLAATLRAFVQTGFQSFWGQFGWMGVVMPQSVYLILLLFTLLTLASLIWFAVQPGRRPTASIGAVKQGAGPGWLPLAIMATTLILSLLLLVVYNLSYVQHQGRYLFPALIPISLGVAAGWGMMFGMLGRGKSALLYLLPLGLGLALFGLDLLALFQFIVPTLS